ncbi:MAG: hypothetical protein RIM99_08635 [Cyclobacteriaceae bacterium]
MKTFIIAFAFLTSLTEKNTTSFTLTLPDGLEMGRTLRTEVDLSFSIPTNDLSYFASSFDAHFDQLGFLKRVVVDREKNHKIPKEWKLSWASSLKETIVMFQQMEGMKVLDRDMSKSFFANDLVDLYFTTNNKTYHFYFVDWKDETRPDGLSSVTITPAVED